ncbi:MAG: aminotransferase class V-fold PLP-dependent enzyme, partial [Planctomycetaceae bacterium]|nr:aminotransferase class V-fold PLP-dependent enzyme [Planctomycetaceae bacterium]
MTSSEWLSDEPWLRWRDEWSLEEDTIYLNHGSFGPSPRCVQEARRQWSQKLEAQPMNFFLRQLESHLDEATAQLGDFVGAAAEDLLFVDNATFGMNIVAASVSLEPGDEVLLTDHEYGAVQRIWRETAKRAGAEVVIASLPFPITSAGEVVDHLFSHVTERTKLIVVSHITSPTAVIFPVAEICKKARGRRVPVCIDGPHAIAMVPLHLQNLDCDYYVASCHKWLSAPFGSGFLYVAKRRQSSMKPCITSWGGSLEGRPSSWQDEFRWIGTRDPAAFLSIPAAIDFLHDSGLEDFRHRTHALASYTRERLIDLTGLTPPWPDDRNWYGSMISLPLPHAPNAPPAGVQRDPLQHDLWKRHRIEIPIIHWHGHRFLRVSCHLYNTQAEIDRMIDALKEMLAEEHVS